MDNVDAGQLRRLARFPTGVPGFDEVLRGGIPRGSVVMVAGSPGTGKTTLGNQLAYRHAGGGATAVFATVMAETHDRMLAHLSNFRFFDPSLVGNRVQYLSVLTALQEGADEALDALRGIVREQGATLLVVDGTAVIADLAVSRLEFRRFTNRLQAQSAVLGCTTVLLINRDPDELGDVATHPDGLVELRQELIGSRRVRTLEVVKLRGTDHLGGRHEFAIGGEGVVVFPRLEAALRDAGPPSSRAGRASDSACRTWTPCSGAGYCPAPAPFSWARPARARP